MKVRRFCYQELILIIASYFPIIWLRFFIIIWWTYLNCWNFHSVKKFIWDGKGRFFDTTKLASVLEEAKAAHKSMADYRERLVDEIAATKDVYFAITMHCCETETWLRLLGLHVRSLNDFISRYALSSLSAICLYQCYRHWDKLSIFLYPISDFCCPLVFDSHLYGLVFLCFILLSSWLFLCKKER